MVQLLLIKLKTVSCVVCFVAVNISRLTENERPTIKDLNRFVIKKYATDWEDIGIELGLEFDVLKIINRDHPLQSIACLRETLDKWLTLNANDATWRTLEVALTNVNRAKLGLDPVDDVYGKDLYYSIVNLLSSCEVLIIYVCFLCHYCNHGCIMCVHITYYK